MALAPDTDFLRGIAAPAWEEEDPSPPGSVLDDALDQLAQACKTFADADTMPAALARVGDELARTAARLNLSALGYACDELIVAVEHGGSAAVRAARLDAHRRAQEAHAWLAIAVAERPL